MLIEYKLLLLSLSSSLVAFNDEDVSIFELKLSYLKSEAGAKFIWNLSW